MNNKSYNGSRCIRKIFPMKLSLNRHQLLINDGKLAIAWDPNNDSWNKLDGLPLACKQLWFDTEKGLAVTFQVSKLLCKWDCWRSFLTPYDLDDWNDDPWRYRWKFSIPQTIARASFGLILATFAIIEWTAGIRFNVCSSIRCDLWENCFQANWTDISN